jgi:hypothetical protein
VQTEERDNIDFSSEGSTPIKKKSRPQLVRDQLQVGGPRRRARTSAVRLQRSTQRSIRLPTHRKPRFLNSPRAKVIDGSEDLLSRMKEKFPYRSLGAEIQGELNRQRREANAVDKVLQLAELEGTHEELIRLFRLTKGHAAGRVDVAKELVHRASAMLVAIDTEIHITYTDASTNPFLQCGDVRRGAKLNLKDAKNLLAYARNVLRPVPVLLFPIGTRQVDEAGKEGHKEIEYRVYACKP